MYILINYLNRITVWNMLNENFLTSFVFKKLNVVKMTYHWYVSHVTCTLTHMTSSSSCSLN